MEGLKGKLEVALQQHQQESSLHRIVWRSRLLERLLDAVHEAWPAEEPGDSAPAINGPCVP